MLGQEEIDRFMKESGATGNGSLEEQLEAWGVDFDDFTIFVGAWCESAATHVAGLAMPQALSVALVAGYELGYRSALSVADRRAETEMTKSGADGPLYVDDIIGEEDAA